MPVGAPWPMLFLASAPAPYERLRLRFTCSSPSSCFAAVTRPFGTCFIMQPALTLPPTQGCAGAPLFVYSDILALACAGNPSRDVLDIASG